MRPLLPPDRNRWARHGVGSGPIVGVAIVGAEHSEQLTTLVRIGLDPLDSGMGGGNHIRLAAPINAAVAVNALKRVVCLARAWL